MKSGYLVAAIGLSAAFMSYVALDSFLKNPARNALNQSARSELDVTPVTASKQQSAQEFDMPSTALANEPSRISRSQSMRSSALTNLIHANHTQFNQNKDRGLSIVRFGATWCPPCREMVPELERLAEKNPDVTVMVIDIDQQQKLAEKYSVESIPHTILFRNGRKVESWVGFQSKEAMQFAVDRESHTASQTGGVTPGSVQQNPFSK